MERKIVGKIIVEYKEDTTEMERHDSVAELLNAVNSFAQSTISDDDSYDRWPGINYAISNIKINES